MKIEKELQKALDEAELRRVIFDSMSANLLKHEEESQTLSQKLTLMKNQIMEADRH